MELQVGQIGDLLSTPEKINYQSRENFLDYDMLLVDLTSVVENQDEDDYITQDDIDSRIECLGDFAQHKPIPPIVFVPIEEYYKLYSNNLYGQVTYKALSVESMLHVGGFSIFTERGKKMNIIPNTPFSDFLREYEHAFAYQSYIDGIDGQVIARIPHKGSPLALYNEQVIFLPQINQGTVPNEKEFLQKLYAAAKSIRQTADVELLPPWAEQYRLPDEAQLVEEKGRIEAQISTLQEALQQKKQIIQGQEAVKQLFTATGTPLEQAVLKLFRDMGVDAEEGERGRADIVIRFGDKVGVIEAKGVTGTAAEKQAAQLEKWVTTYYDDHDIHPKGILIVNSFHQTELKDRDATTFPNQMLKFTKSREHCLITTTQLLGLYFECKTHPERRDELIQSLFDAVGIYEGFEDWRQFITEKAE